MFKTVIAPIQAWLMSRGQCVACGMPLNKGKVDNFDGTQEKVTCKCGRTFIHDIKGNTYRRALFSELK